MRMDDKNKFVRKLKSILTNRTAQSAERRSTGEAAAPGARAEARTPTETGKRPKAAQKTNGQAGTAGQTGSTGAGGTAGSSTRTAARCGAKGG